MRPLQNRRENAGAFVAIEVTVKQRAAPLSPGAAAELWFADLRSGMYRAEWRRFAARRSVKDIFAKRHMMVRRGRTVAAFLSEGDHADRAASGSILPAFKMESYVQYSAQKV